MKKAISFLLVSVLCMALTVPAFAASDHTEDCIKTIALSELPFSSVLDVSMLTESGEINDHGFRIDEEHTLIIGKDVTLLLNDVVIRNAGTLIVCGKLEIGSDAQIINSGSIKVVDGCGQITGTITGNTTVEHITHYYDENSVCIFCGYECPHDGEHCVECGKVIRTMDDVPVGYNPTPSKTTLPLIPCIVCLAAGFLAGMFIFKKKPSSANGTDGE